MIENDTWYRCNICGRERRVARCCSDEDRTPLNALAKAEQERIKGGKNGEKIEATFEWFILTVEDGLAGSFPKDMDKRIDFCKRQIEAHKIAKNTEQANQPD